MRKVIGFFQERRGEVPVSHIILPQLFVFFVVESGGGAVLGPLQYINTFANQFSKQIVSGLLERATSGGDGSLNLVIGQISFLLASVEHSF